MEVEAAQSEFVERGKTLRRLFVLQVGEVVDLKGEEQLIADHLMDQGTQQKQYEADQGNNFQYFRDLFRRLRFLHYEESVLFHFEGNLHLWEDRFFLSKDNCDIGIIVLEVFSVFHPYRQSVIGKGMRNCAVGSIGDEKDTVCLHELRNCYLGRESEGKNCLILKGDFLGFYKQ